MFYNVMRLFLKFKNVVHIDLWSYDNAFGFDIEIFFSSSTISRKFITEFKNYSKRKHTLQAYEDFIYTFKRENENE